MLPLEIDPAGPARRREIGGRVAAARPPTPPRPDWWISRGFSAARADMRTVDRIHRAPGCPVSDLNVPWRAAAMYGPKAAFDLVAVNPHIRLCAYCFTELEMMTMGTELAYYQSPPQTLTERQAYAVAIKNAPSLPDNVRGHEASVLLAMDLADALMIRRGVAFTQMHFMKGVPVPNANLINALVRRAGHRLRVVEGRNDKGVLYATATIIRTDDPEFVYAVTWDMDRAKLAKLDTHPTWLISPQGNLKRRAITEVARDACPEVFMGMDLTAAISIDVDVDGLADGSLPASQPASADDGGGIVDAEVVDEPVAATTAAETLAADLAAARAAVQAAADTIGWTTPDMRREYAAEYAGGELGDADAGQLQTFARLIEARLEKFANATP